MSCKDFEELIALDVAGDLPASDVTQVQKHLSQCSACRDFAAELSTDLEWLQSAHQETLDPAALHQVRVGVMCQLEAEQSRRTPPFGGLAAYGWRWQWVIATAAVAIVLGSLAWWNTSLERPQDAVAVDSEDPNQQRPETEPPFERPAESNVAKADPPVRVIEKKKAAISSPPARQDFDPDPLGETEVNPARTTTRPDEALKDSSRAPQMAGLAPRKAIAARKPEPSFESLDSERRLEIVTAQLDEPQQEPAEAVMLKIPTSNPNVVVYWLMDNEQEPEQIEENKGD